MGSNPLSAPYAHARAASTYPATTATPHPGGKIPHPHFGHTPYSRINSTFRPPCVSSFRFFFPFFSNFSPHCGHTTPAAPLFHSAWALAIAVSEIIFARNAVRRLSCCLLLLASFPILPLFPKF